MASVTVSLTNALEPHPVSHKHLLNRSSITKKILQPALIGTRKEETLKSVAKFTKIEVSE